jgi:hypothetical protein
MMSTVGHDEGASSVFVLKGGGGGHRGKVFIGEIFIVMHRDSTSNSISDSFFDWMIPLGFEKGKKFHVQL